MATRVGPRTTRRVVEYMTEHEGVTMRDAAAALNVSLSTVHAAVREAGLVRVVTWRRP